MSKIVAPDVEMTEEDRLAVLRGLGALDSDPDPYFDRIVRLAAALFGAPSSGSSGGNTPAPAPWPTS
ncbi:MAG: hypothetical protein K0R83_3005 [Caulobacter sp.]|nr:hypothetical protein [Caulobacter sp.]